MTIDWNLTRSAVGERDVWQWNAEDETHVYRQVGGVFLLMFLRKSSQTSGRLGLFSVTFQGPQTMLVRRTSRSRNHGLSGRFSPKR